MKKTSESIEKFRKGDSGPKYLFRGPHCEWGIIVLKPGEKMGSHGHRQVIEDFCFIEGNPKIIVDNTELRVNPGDAVRVEPGESHDIVNDTEKRYKTCLHKIPVSS